MKTATNTQLPDYFRPVLWSYDFPKIDPDEDKETIIINSINYGDLRHWRWIASHYGKEETVEIIEKIPATAVRNRVMPLVSLLFGSVNWNYAPRGVNH